MPRNEARRENKLLGSLLGNVVAYEVEREATVLSQCRSLIGFSIAVLIGSCLIGPGMCLAMPVRWAQVTLMSIGLGVLVLAVAVMVVSVVSGMRVRGARAFADWAPGGVLDSFGSESDRASRTLIDSQREAVSERSAVVTGASKLLSVAEGLFMGVLALLVAGAVFAFIVALAM